MVRVRLKGELQHVAGGQARIFKNSIVHMVVLFPKKMRIGHFLDSAGLRPQYHIFATADRLGSQ